MEAEQRVAQACFDGGVVGFDPGKQVGESGGGGHGAKAGQQMLAGPLDRLDDRLDDGGGQRVVFDPRHGLVLPAGPMDKT